VKTSTSATDVPRYRVFRAGERVAEVATSARCGARTWSPSSRLLVFLEQRAVEAGLRLRYVRKEETCRCTAPSIDTAPAGRFRGKLVVSMRPFKPRGRDPRNRRSPPAIQGVHGAPVHLGRPDLIGIEDLGHPWAGDPTEVREDELPLSGPAASRRNRWCSTRVPRCASRTRRATCW